MGIEQGTPVADFSTGLPFNIDLLDLPDLRLPRALTAWATFRQNHGEQISRLGTLQLEEVVSFNRYTDTSTSACGPSI